MSEELRQTPSLAVAPVKWTIKSPVVKFATVGISGTLVNTLVLYLLYRGLRLPLAVSSILAVESAVLNNFVLNDRWTFGHAGPSFLRFIRFNAASLAGLLVNVVTISFLTHAGMSFLAADLLGIAAAFALNFVLSSRWVWVDEA
jgi:putative flippase GtrA